MYKVFEIPTRFNDIKNEPHEKIQESVLKLIHPRTLDVVKFRTLEDFNGWVKKHRKASSYNTLRFHLLGCEYQDSPFSVKKLIYIHPISCEKFELPVIDSGLSQDELYDLTQKFLRSIPSIREKEKAPKIIEKLSSIIETSSDERQKENAGRRIQDFDRPYEQRYTTHQLIIAQLNLKIKKAINDPRWDTMGVGFFGSKTPTTIAQLRTLFSDVEKPEHELMDEAERILENSLKRTPTFRSTEVELLYRTLLHDISDFRENYSFAKKPAENNTASGNGLFSFFTSFYETNIRPYFGSDNHPPEVTL
jgi:hypothetical protein